MEKRPRMVERFFEEKGILSASDLGRKRGREEGSGLGKSMVIVFPMCRSLMVKRPRLEASV